MNAEFFTSIVGVEITFFFKRVPVSFSNFVDEITIELMTSLVPKDIMGAETSPLGSAKRKLDTKKKSLK